MTNPWSSWTPVLKVADARASQQFYCDVLGFEKNWEHQFQEDWPLYMSVSRDSVTLHLSEHGEEPTAITLVVGVEDVDRTYEEIRARGFEPEGPPENRPYGTRDFAFPDPDGHRLVVSMPLSNFKEAEGRTMEDDR